MTLEEIHVGDIGTKLVLEIIESGVAADISAATNMRMRFQKPSGDTLDKAATFVTDGTDGQIQYVTVSGDLDETGWWTRQAFLTLGSWSGQSSRVRFEVCGNILDTHPS